MPYFDLSKNPYDYDSIMHYDSYAFSKDKDHLMTIIPKKSNLTIGQRFYLSPLDAMKINSFYQCDGNAAIVYLTASSAKMCLLLRLLFRCKANKIEIIGK